MRLQKQTSPLGLAQSLSAELAPCVFGCLGSSVQTFSYSVIVFDTAPTGHTLRLLSFPSLVEKALGKLAAIKGNLSAAVGLLGAFSNGSASVSADDVSLPSPHERSRETAVRWDEGRRRVPSWFEAFSPRGGFCCCVACRFLPQ